MFNTWRASTIVFVFQLALGLSWFAETKNVEGSAVVVMIVTFMIASGLSGSLVDDDVYAVSLPACAGAFAVFMVTIDQNVGFIAALITAVILAYLVAAAGDRGQREPGILILIASLPLGIGTVLGGSVLLFLHLRDTANEPIA